MSMRRAGSDEGQVLLLSIALGVVVLALVMVLGSIASIYLERKQLFDLADSMAADAADALDEDLYFDDPGSEVTLSDASVAASVADYLAGAPATTTSRFEHLRVVSATTPDGRTARVHVTSRARPPLIPWVLVPWSDGFTIEAVSLARAD
ncbi:MULTISPECIES: hypothetical protein [unclassified Pseudactinotalea]|uniref:hypothetical protein n=1 Tax=unclassified Pseudactinotalea TaxID=2649176 RepID=UPI00128DB447|nr:MULTISPECIES: hypothetical protein [unclassified Pseudactinotalea]MPV49881.1 hypothetical protein [Pseudactinotalea sp. HY160]QGH69144.1 hypothetical protein GCE65_06205 [Pseudactinotalea sp. HY158]